MATNSDDALNELKTYIQSRHWKQEDITEHFENVSEIDLNEKGLRIDLHGCSIQQAKERTIDIIKKGHSNQTYQLIHIITGRGKHLNSNGTKGVIFEELQKWVKDPEIAPLVKEVKKNNGAYLITLNKPYKESKENNLYQLNESSLHEFAKSGNKNAQFALGKRLLEKENKESQIWLLKAAEQGHVEAMVLVGYCHAMGRNAQYSPQEAMRWYRRAASKNPGACINLGTMYWSGQAGLVDLEKTIDWYKQAEKLGSIEAQRLLGIVFFVLKCYEEAAIWNHKASKNNDHHAQVNLGVMYQKGLGISKDEKRAIDLFKAAAAGGIAEGKMRLGQVYLNGIGVDKDYKAAAKLFLEVGLSNHDSVGADCQFFLYCMYKDGLGFTANMEIAEQWLRRAANNNHPEALFTLKNEPIYLTASNANQDLVKKMECLEVDSQQFLAPLTYYREATEIRERDSEKSNTSTSNLKISKKSTP